ncbi:MAG: glycosyltransferase family 4 protein, partial [Sphingomonas sp.]
GRYRLSVPIMRVIPNPVPVPPDRDAWSLERATADQMLCVGRFDLRKGADIVIRAFAEAVKQRPSLSLVMAGPDSGLVQPTGNRVHFAEFVASQIAPEARSRITFLGPQPSQRIHELRLQSRVAIVGSRFETFSYVAAESMALGMPVLATDIYGPGEFIRDGIDGRIVPVEDVGALARGMVEMSSDQSRLAQMGRAARERVRECFSPERIAKDSVAVYREVLAAHSR